MFRVLWLPVSTLGILCLITVGILAAGIGSLVFDPNDWGYGVADFFYFGVWVMYMSFIYIKAIHPKLKNRRAIVAARPLYQELAKLPIEKYANYPIQNAAWETFEVSRFSRRHYWIHMSNIYPRPFAYEAWSLSGGYLHHVENEKAAPMEVLEMILHIVRNASLSGTVLIATRYRDPERQLEQ